SSPTQQLLLERSQLGRRARSQLVTQARAQRFIDAQRLGSVAAGSEDLHEQRVRALAKGCIGDQFARHALARRQLAAADAESDRGVALERRAVDLLEPAAMRVGPRQILARQETASGGEQG